MSRGPRQVWIDGELEERASSLDRLIRAIRYGDGVFITTRVIDGRMLDLRRLATRLLGGARRIGIDPPDGFHREDEIVERLRSVPLALGVRPDTEHVLRCQWSAAGSERGYGRGAESLAVVELAPAPSRQSPSVTVLADDAVPVPGLPDVKSCSSLVHVIAARSFDRARFDEAIRVLGGWITEAIASNLFFEREGRLHTPSTALPLYPGVVRQRVIEQAGELGITVLEGCWSAADLASCDGAFLTNCVRGVEPIATLDGRALTVTDTTSAIAASVSRVRMRDAVHARGGSA